VLRLTFRGLGCWCQVLVAEKVAEPEPTEETAPAEQ
jgi:hypothetical protein